MSEFKPIQPLQLLPVYNVCPECMGRGAYDDPPWGIVTCNRCGGTGEIISKIIPKS